MQHYEESIMNLFKIRQTVQWVTFVLGVLTFVVFAVGAAEGVAHSHCPFSSVCFGLLNLNPDVHDPIFPLFSIGDFVVTVPLVMLALSALTLFLGRIFCGWVCPIGTLQEKLYLASHCGIKRFNQRIPYRVHRWLKWLKYVVLLAVAALAFFALNSYYMGFCPVLAFAYPTTIAWAGLATLLVVIVVSGFIVERFWCRYLCPYAAMLNLFMHLGNWARVPRLKVKRNIKTSLECFNCVNYCPMFIDIGYNESIESAECIQCQHCVRRCSKTKDGKKKCLYCQ